MTFFWQNPVPNPRRGEVIPSKRWRHKRTGRTASLYGAVPWTGAPGDREEDWVLETVGWTIRWDDGTIGIGREPFKTEQEARAWLSKRQSNPRGRMCVDIDVPRGAKYTISPAPGGTRYAAKKSDAVRIARTLMAQGHASSVYDVRDGRRVWPAG